ncbi:MAG: glycosyltransferase family 2 protein [Oscillospiraceae bacterium]|nr:glycosyltransferase family 2 protein [Oscillospiraceae bacterium]
MISVIIPVYKVEAYLNACIDSVLAQTYKNFEIILVDDGSPDNSGLICDRYREKYENIKVIHKENGGLSSARNAGIEIAGGELIAFIDSDDLWSADFLTRSYDALKETGADMSVCRFMRFSDLREISAAEYSETKCLSQSEAFECLFDARNEDMVIATNKLYRKKLFADIRYPHGVLHEDECVIHELIGASDKIAWVDEVHYFYRTNPNSITGAKFSLKRLEETLAKERRIAWFTEHGMDELANRTKIVYLNNLMRLYRTVQHEIEDKKAAKEACEKLYEKFCSNYSSGLNGKMSRTAQIKCALFRFFPKVYSSVEYARLKRKGIV